MLLRNLAILVFLLTAHLSFSQQFFSYAYSGHINNETDFQSKVLKISEIKSCKIRQKETKGELLIELKNYEVTYDKNGEINNPSPLIKLKKIVLEQGLNPIELNELKS